MNQNLKNWKIKLFTTLEREDILRVKPILKVRLEPFLNVVRGIIAADKNFWVSGGCIASILQDEMINDIDVYFRDDGIGRAVKEYYINSYPDEIMDINTKYQEIEVDGKLVTTNAVTLKNGIQIITKHYGAPDEVRKTFDFVHCLPYYDSLTDNLFISEEQYRLCKNKLLKINNTKTTTAGRTTKFTERGYKFNVLQQTEEQNGNLPQNTGSSISVTKLDWFTT